VAGDADAVAVDHAQLDGLLDGCARIFDQLLGYGSATWAIGGYSTHDTRRIVSWVGLTKGSGGDGAWSTSRTCFGGLS
jgi:hypothetical protein